MELKWIIEIVKTQGVAIGGFAVLLFVLIKFIQKVLNNAQSREEMLTKLLTNHLEEFNKSLITISENLKKSSEQHIRIIELLIKIAERVKYGN